jgi:hypothetical protein
MGYNTEVFADQMYTGGTFVFHVDEMLHQTLLSGSSRISDVFEGYSNARCSNAAGMRARKMPRCIYRRRISEKSRQGRHVEVCS